ncbi:MAG: two-component system, NarL family, sensor kinase, partial [Gaiellales bacterium]|nr:two-component system, NarL family, sensor kinase [Gaiellales bacterium]
AIAVALVGGYFALRSVAIDQAKRDTRTKAQQSAQLVESALVDGLVTGDPAALAAVDDLVVARVLSSSVVRVKIWSAAGHVLYSDNAAEIGGHYALDQHQLRLLREGGAAVEVTNLARPENALDRAEGDLIESYTRVRTPSGTPLLFEIYERFDSVTASARRLLRALAPPILGAIALIVLVQAPLAWSLTRRLQRGYEEREALLANAIAASNRERRRIASYLHDGSVQEIAGVAFALAPLADAATARGATTEAQELRGAIEQLRHNVRGLRTLLLDLHPPHLAAAGLASSLADLVSPLQARGVEVSVAIDGADSLDDSQEALIYRAAQEAVRNVLAYSDARTVDVELTSAEGVARLVVRDDGSGFSPEVRERRKAEGHLGLSLLEELVRQAGGRLDVRSGEGLGTTVELEVPPR